MVKKRPEAVASLAPRWRSRNARAEPIPTADERWDVKPTFVPLHTLVPVLSSSRCPPFLALMPSKGAFDTARMNRQAPLFL